MLSVSLSCPYAFLAIENFQLLPLTASSPFKGEPFVHFLIFFDRAASSHECSEAQSLNLRAQNLKSFDSKLLNPARYAHEIRLASS